MFFGVLLALCPAAFKTPVIFIVIQRSVLARVRVLRVFECVMWQAAEYFEQLKQSDAGWHLCISALVTQSYST